MALPSISKSRRLRSSPGDGGQLFSGGSSSNTAIHIKDGFFFGSNITVQGYGTTVNKKGQAAQASGSIEEYNSEAITAYSSSRVRPTAVKSMNLPIEDYP